jgi:1-acyl-sn-glycerol-3-phosphate acyltransferase
MIGQPCRTPRPDWGNAWLNRLDALVTAFCRSYHRLQCSPIALPERGPAIVAANHLSGLDPLLMIAASPRPLRFIIAREEYEKYGLTWLFRAIGCIPVERQQRPQRALRAALRALEAGEVVALFPEGRLRPPHEPPHRLKPGAVWLAQAVGCPIFPVRLEGIRGAGKTLPAVFLRSQARLISCQPLHCGGLGEDDCLQRLHAQLIAAEHVELASDAPIS